MRKIKLTQGKFALVDNEDYKRLNQYKWCAAKAYKVFYVTRAERKAGVKKTIFMHREIMNAKKGQKIDHKDQDGLNNQKNNLRFCNSSQNASNRGPQTNNKSGYKGVFWSKQNSTWYSQIVVNQQKKHLGCFKNKKEAAKAYDEASKKYFKEFAYTNF